MEFSVPVLRGFDGHFCPLGIVVKGAVLVLQCPVGFRLCWEAPEPLFHSGPSSWQILSLTCGEVA